MTLPGSTVEILDSPPPVSALVDTGTAFVVGLADRGDTAAQLTPSDVVHSIAEWEAIYGTRQSYNGPEYDAIEAFFAEGGSDLYFSRYVGPAAVKATITVPSSSSQWNAVAKSPGAWGNALSVTVASSVVTVKEGSTTVETSPTLATISALIDWATNTSTYIDATAIASLSASLTNSAARTLATGADDRASADDGDRGDALDRFGRDLGPGSVLIPGQTGDTVYTAIATHARDTNRFGYCDAPNSTVAATVAAAGTTIRALGADLARHVQVLAPWVTAQGAAAGTTVTVPPSGIQAGMAARTDSQGNPNRATAARNGISRKASDVAATYTDADRETLADAGITVIRNVGGAVMTYDDITPVNPATDPEWLGAAGNRMVMRIVADALEIADAHLFASTSGPADLAAFNGDLKGMLNRWFIAGALYSATGDPSGAFRVETGSAVNTPTTLAARQLRAALALKLSPNARQVIVQITNTPIQSAL